LNGLRLAFSKFDAICQSMNPPATEDNENEISDDEASQLNDDETRSVEGQ
jgi:hypothetical protein